jgi:hypothetical protein
MSQEIRLTISGLNAPMKKRIPSASTRFLAPRIPSQSSLRPDLESGGGGGGSDDEAPHASRVYHSKKSFRNIPWVMWIGAIWLVVTSIILFVHLSSSNGAKRFGVVSFVPSLGAFNVSLGTTAYKDCISYVICCQTEQQQRVLRCGASSPTQCVLALQDGVAMCTGGGGAGYECTITLALSS